MWIELPNLWIAVLNALGIPLAHLAIAWSSNKLPASWFDFPAQSKSNGNIYKRLFGVRLWKDFLPDGAAWLNGFTKAKLRSSDPDYLYTFLKETRRGELSHWLQWIAISLFILWTPSPYHLIILGYAAISNLPCIINLRYTRIRLARVLKKANTNPLI